MRQGVLLVAGMCIVLLAGCGGGEAQTKSTSAPVRAEFKDDAAISGTWKAGSGQTISLKKDGTFVGKTPEGKLRDEGTWRAAQEDGQWALYMHTSRALERVIDGKTVSAEAFKSLEFDDATMEAYYRAQSEALKSLKPATFEGADGAEHTIAFEYMQVDWPEKRADFFKRTDGRLDWYATAADAAAGSKPVGTWTLVQ